MYEYIDSYSYEDIIGFIESVAFSLSYVSDMAAVFTDSNKDGLSAMLEVHASALHLWQKQLEEKLKKDNYIF